MKIVIASDHAALEMKNYLVSYLQTTNHEVVDLGTYTKDAVDYPDFGAKVGRAISRGEAERGIIICGTGIGISIAANRFPKVRAALCNELLTVELAREHNDANVLALGARIISLYKAKCLVDTFLKLKPLGGRHALRVNKLAHIDIDD